ncbi:hypothetical protein HPB49_011835 [Dermacentor silvarum]|uniref:Uncharacterized protein n=1 Tax=Dermacentor silvarum TaxID=543639 RepID=A0ACB8DZC6_DERSI|nr:hypothetical protein HPB49_011835 [Dermacentor silvarum]
MSFSNCLNVTALLLQAIEKIQEIEDGDKAVSLHRRVLLEQLLKKWAWLDDSESSSSSSDDDDGGPPAPAIAGVKRDRDVGDNEVKQSSNENAADQGGASPAFGDAEPGPSKCPRVDEEQCLDCRPGPSGLQSSHIPAEVEDQDDPYPVKVAPFLDWLDFAGTVADEPVQDPDLSFLDL